MPLYTIKQTSMKGQVILTSTHTRGNAGICPIVSLQMPEERAKQIVAALDFIEQLGKVTENELDLMLALNTRASLVGLITAAAKINGMQIEKT